MCCHRHPLGGRNFESYSEDPFLAGKLAASNVKGIQSTGVSATIKHFAANEQETLRLSVDEIISERALREIYLKPFEFAVKEANPDAVMTAYNKVNGHHADSQQFLLQQVLRGEWGWEGLVMSDWGGTNSTAEALNAGLDLEMPGPTRWRKPDAVLAAIKAGKVTEETINERTLRVLKFLEHHDRFNNPEIPPEQAINKPEHQALIREAGAKGIVLLKNEKDLLPLTKTKARGRKIALLGYAKECLSNGGGSASVNAHYKVTPYDALQEAFKGEDVEFTYAKGARTQRQFPLITENVVDVDGKPGFTRRMFEQGKSKPYMVVNHPNSQVSLLDTMEIFNNTTELEGTYTASKSGTFYFTLSGLGPSSVTFNGELVFEQKDSTPDPMGFLLGGVSAPVFKLELVEGKKYKILIKSQPPIRQEDEDLGILEGKVGVRLDHISQAENDEDVTSAAVELAQKADYAIVFTGHDPSWETEGQDQVSFSLPKDGSQDRLVSSVAAVNANTIVVNSTGVAVAMPWLEQVSSVLQAWFPGQEAGNSIADVLLGAQNPEGRLPCTFPKRLEDCPAYGNFPGQYEDRKLTVKYAEEVFVGYRHFDRLAADKVNFPFGFGLSYTSFDYADLTVKGSGDEWAVSIKVSNTGAIDGATTVQVYVGSKKTAPENPIKALVAFRKVAIPAGGSRLVELPVRARDFAFWSQEKKRWVVEAGDYNFGVARNAADQVAVAVVKVDEQVYSP